MGILHDTLRDIRDKISVKDHLRRAELNRLVREKAKSINVGGKFDEEKALWISGFHTMFAERKNEYLRHSRDIVTGFFDEPLETVKIADSYRDFSTAVVVCSVKNDISYLREFLQYYRKLGVRNFAFVDNGSSDGTVEFLMEQSDVSLYVSRYRFNGAKKLGWKLQIIAKMGMNHWYLLLDSDEFFCYLGQEKNDLSAYLHQLAKKGYRSVHGFLLDMYPEYPLMDGKHKNGDFFRDYRYFDGASMLYHHKGNRLSGGMRERVMHAEMRLDKHPLFYCCEGHIPTGNHDICGLKKNPKENDYCCVLRHYKFLPEDTEKYKRIAQPDSGYSCISLLEKYVNSDGEGILAYYSESELLDCSEKLKTFTFLKDLFV